MIMIKHLLNPLSGTKIVIKIGLNPSFQKQRNANRHKSFVILVKGTVAPE